MNKGKLIVVSGPSGVGKDTVVSEYIKKYDNAWLSISTTSRAMRPGDVEGEIYNFVTKEEFEKLIEEDYFLEYASYVDKYYGTPKKFINEKLAEGKDVFLVIEIQGAMKIKELIPEALFIFLLPPNLKTLRQRLKNRGTETKEKIKASKKLEAGPAKAVKAISRFGFLKYLESTITGFAHPTRKRSKAIKPKGSICFSGFKDNRP